MSADEKRKLFAVARGADDLRRDAERTVERAGDVLREAIVGLEAELAAERAKCGPGCRHG